MIRRSLRLDALLLVALIGLHELLRHALAGDAIVSALFAPGGAHVKWTLLVGIFFVALRVCLFVGVPGWVAAEGVLLVWKRVSRSPEGTNAGER